MGQQEGPRWGGVTPNRAGLAFCLLAVALVALVGLRAESSPAQDPPASSIVSIAEAADRDCGELQAPGAPGVELVDLGSPDLADGGFGMVQARLEGPSGSDWDLTIFDSAGEVVTASAFRGPSEVASGYFDDDGGLTAQVCRLSGEGTGGELSVWTDALEPTKVEPSSLANVKVTSAAEEAQLQDLGLDLTEHGGDDYIAVVLHGDEDREALEKAGLDYEIEVGNLDRQSARQRSIDADFAAETQRSSLPSGSDTYRRLADYSRELKELAERNPEIVKPITLDKKTYEGRPVEGIEITTDPDTIRDGKPVFLQMGVHHAREWPSGEHAMEWAYELVKGYRKDDQRVVRLLKQTRTIVIPIVNPDGFNASREAGQQLGHGNGQDGSYFTSFPAAPNEYRRKNCRNVAGDGGTCVQPSLGLAALGVDPNRNYGAFWGGPGASGDATNETYYGPGPFSEPETKNIRQLVSTRQVTTLITNHTFSALVLRPPGLASQPDPIDEPIYKALGDAMSAENGYSSQKGYELYDTSGTTEDWSYNATGGLGFTYEIYCDGIPDPTPVIGDPRCTGNFHPTYPNVVAEYDGTSSFANASTGGGGNREAYFLALENTADASKHSVLTGKAPPGAILQLEKTFQTPTSVEDPASIEDHLETEMKVPNSGEFDYHINPSTRPLVAQPQGRPSQGSPSAPIAFNGAPDLATNRPCGANQSTDPDCFTDHPFEVTAGAGVDNDSVTVEVEWGSPVSDWDLYVYTDSDGDGTSLIPDGSDEGTEPDVEPNLVGSSATGATDAGNSETTQFVRPETGDGRVAPGKYVVRVENYAAVEPYDGTITFEGPGPFTPAQTETWKLTCFFADEARVKQDILIGRGETKNLDLSDCGTRSDGSGGGGGGSGGGGAKDDCRGTEATLVGSRKADRIVGTKGRDVIVGLGGNDTIRGRGGNDIVCGRGGKDKVVTGAGEDTIKAGGGNDRVNGGDDKDVISGGGGNDRINGGDGPDKLRGGKGEDECIARREDDLSGCES